MAEKFNVKPHELENYDPDWIDRMIAVSEGEFIATQNQQSSNVPQGNASTIVNKISTTYGGNK